MKRIVPVLLALVLLSGCAGSGDGKDQAMAFREKLLSAQGCSFDAEITADYGDKVYTFSVSCQGDSNGDMTFAVSAPEAIAGIGGKLTGSGGSLTFDDQALAFALLADGQLSPVSAPWIFLHTLRGGYLTAFSQEGETLRLSIDDSYEADALHLDIWMGADGMPTGAEILWGGKRILSLSVTNFTLL